jgi:acyl-CoA reductase-like NAD-dependent aldehyde dehydrogenase
VLDNADPTAIAKQIFWAAFTNCGQVCTAIKRVYVPASIHNDLTDALAAYAATIAVGDGMDPSTQLGPVNNPAQLDRIAGLVDDAAAAGAKVATGGHRLDRPGYFYRPTILSDTPPTSRIVLEEQFGPALPLVPVKDETQAVVLANSTKYGLGASIWSSDPGRAESVAAQLQCGTTWVNTHMASRRDQPFSGWKSSGIGVENGIRGLEAYTEFRVLYRRGQR